MSGLSHIDAAGRARMVDVGDKAVTRRTAEAVGQLRCSEATLRLVRTGETPKGNVIATAELAGVMAAKQTAVLIPLCHPLPLSQVVVDIALDADLPGFSVRAQVRTTGQTGVEMEALTAVSVACLTLFDMLKAVDKAMEIGAIRVTSKTGGRSGSWQALISYDTAISLLADTVQPLSAERVSLDVAADRCLAEPLHARCASPRVAVSAMDGYAVLDAATRPDEPLRVIGEARPGMPFAGKVGPGETVRLFTGAPVPAGTDRVIVQEHAERAGDVVRFSAGYGPGRHVRTSGSDFAAGALLLAAGTRLTPRALIAAAAADRAQLAVHRRPQVAILGTGDELVAPGTAAAQAHAIPESVTYGVAALVRESGAEVVWRGTHGDDLAGLTSLAGDLLGRAELVIMTGGASVGEYDFAKAMFAPFGLELVFSRLAIKPGKPVWFGRAQGRLVLGLPGNPTSAMVTASLFLRPLLALLQGQSLHDALRWRRLPLAAPLPETDERETFVRAIWGSDGLTPVSNQDSGAQAALARSDWLIRCPAGTPAQASGVLVSALAF